MVYFLDYWGLWVVHLNSAVNSETQQYSLRIDPAVTSCVQPYYSSLTPTIQA